VLRDKDPSACEHVDIVLLYYCNVGLLHDNRWSLCPCNILLCTVVSCHSECCSDHIFLFHTEVSGEYVSYVIMMASSKWMLKVQAANSFENCWTDRREEEGPDHYVSSVCVFTLPRKQLVSNL